MGFKLKLLLVFSLALALVVGSPLSNMKVDKLDKWVNKADDMNSKKALNKFGELCTKLNKAYDNSSTDDFNEQVGEMVDACSDLSDVSPSAESRMKRAFNMGRRGYYGGGYWRKGGVNGQIGKGGNRADPRKIFFEICFTIDKINVTEFEYSLTADDIASLKTVLSEAQTICSKGKYIANGDAELTAIVVSLTAEYNEPAISREFSRTMIALIKFGELCTELTNVYDRTGELTIKEGNLVDICTKRLEVFPSQERVRKLGLREELRRYNGGYWRRGAMGGLTNIGGYRPDIGKIYSDICFVVNKIDKKEIERTLVVGDIAGLTEALSKTETICDKPRAF